MKLKNDFFSFKDLFFSFLALITLIFSFIFITFFYFFSLPTNLVLNQINDKKLNFFHPLLT